MIRYDLHCHSTHSDGLLTPAEVIRRAAAHGVDVVALTDHDELSGLAEAREAARECGIAFIDGAELSATWEDDTVHIVGLRVDPADASLVAGLSSVRSGRDARARRIGDALDAVGVHDAFEGAQAHATGGGLIARTHFARHLIATGHARDMKDAFRRFLTTGKPGHVPHAWATLTQAVDWIRRSGGQAVLAHPGRYRLTEGAMERLLGEFRDLGGDAIEVLSPSHTPAQYVEFAAAARRFGLAVSGGSDFHAPGESRMDIGGLPTMPAGAEPVWRTW